MNKFLVFLLFCAYTLAWSSKQVLKTDHTTVFSSTTLTTLAAKNGTSSMNSNGISTKAKILQTTTTAEATTLAPTASVFTAKTTKASPTKKAGTTGTIKSTKKISATTTTKTQTTSILTTILPKTKLATTATPKATQPLSISKKTTATTITSTTTTTTTQATTTVPNAPDSLMFQNLLKVRQCSCDETEACALSAGSQISDCKKQCAHKMEYFGQDIDKLVSCFMKTEEELRAFDKCLSSNNNFCVSNNNTLVYIDTPNYASFISNQSLRATEIDAVKGGVLVKKARKAFVHFRLFQKCVANCLKHQIVQCYGVARCAVPVPSGEELGEILDGCSQMKVHDHVHSACHCLVQKQQVRKLIGVCPLVLDRHLMRRL